MNGSVNGRMGWMTLMEELDWWKKEVDGCTGQMKRYMHEGIGGRNVVIGEVGSHGY